MSSGRGKAEGGTDAAKVGSHALMLAAQLDLDAEFTPAVAAYWARLQARPAFQAAKASQIAHAPAGAEASPI